MHSRPAVPVRLMLWLVVAWPLAYVLMQTLAFVQPPLALFDVPLGVGLSALLLARGRERGWVTMLVWLLAAVFHAWSGTGGWTSVLLAAAETGLLALAAWLLTPGGRIFRLSTPLAAVRFLAVLVPLVLLLALARLLAGPVLLPWWPELLLSLADGMLLVVPVLLHALGSRDWLSAADPPFRHLAGMVCLGLMTLVLALVFGEARFGVAGWGMQPLVWLPLVLLALTVMYWPGPGSSLAVFWLALLSGLATVAGMGPFARMALAMPLSVLNVQFYVAGAAVLVLALGAFGLEWRQRVWRGLEWRRRCLWGLEQLGVVAFEFEPGYGHWRWQGDTERILEEGAGTLADRRHVLAHVPAGQRQALDEALTAASMGDAGHVQVWDWHDRNGAVRPVRWRLAVEWDDSGEVCLVRGLLEPLAAASGDTVVV